MRREVARLALDEVTVALKRPLATDMAALAHTVAVEERLRLNHDQVRVLDALLPAPLDRGAGLDTSG